MKTPIKSLAISMPFPGSVFLGIWVTYKNYLSKEHKQQIGNRRELVMLERLKQLSENDERIAIEMLKYFISSGFKHLFKPSPGFFSEIVKEKGSTV